QSFMQRKHLPEFHRRPFQFAQAFDGARRRFQTPLLGRIAKQCPPESTGGSREFPESVKTEINH
ncbi:MAG TPA: hypothetical protein PLD60_14410, partial [Leptospiraceae bacterium]|nr:hypothetical protein [Leptospiraceae bacterium]